MAASTPSFSGDDLERLSSQELFAELHSRLLERHVRAVLKRSPFYREKAAQAHFRLAGRAFLERFQELPFTDKKELMEEQQNHPPFGRLATAHTEASLQRVHLTSGSSGRPYYVALTKRDVHWNVISGRRAFRCAGVTPGDVIIHCLNYCMWAGGLTDHLSLEATGAAVIPFGVGNTKKLVEVIRALRPTAISCTPSYMSRLEVVLKDDFGLGPPELGLRKGLFGGEGGLQNPAFRSRLEQTWRIQAIDANYGMADVLSIFGAECRCRTGLHFHGQGILHLELIDPANGAVLPLEPGARGEMTLTTLRREAQPLLRYRTGDLITVLGNDLCPCGRRSLRFRVDGRADDMVVVRGINVYPAAIKQLLAENPLAYGGQFELVLESPPPFERPILRIEMAEAFRGDKGALAATLAKACHERLSFTPVVQVLPWGALPRTEGKTRYIRRQYKPAS
jgi:phenylacetate-CoA ligase